MIWYSNVAPLRKAVTASCQYQFKLIGSTQVRFELYFFQPATYTTNLVMPSADLRPWRNV